MAFTITHRGGEDEDGDLTMLPALLDELYAGADDEHPDVMVADESGWTLSAFGSGYVIWENPEERTEPRHLRGLERHEIHEIMKLVAAGDLAGVEALEWRPGY